MLYTVCAPLCCAPAAFGESGALDISNTAAGRVKSAPLLMGLRVPDNVSELILSLFFHFHQRNHEWPVPTRPWADSILGPNTLKLLTFAMGSARGTSGGFSPLCSHYKAVTSAVFQTTTPRFQSVHSNHNSISSTSVIVFWIAKGWIKDAC